MATRSIERPGMPRQARGDDPAVRSAAGVGGGEGAGDRGGQLFTAVSLSRASQAIVEQIRGLMHEGKLRSGDRLPSERELCQQFGVSRVTVREALRILETNGLVSIRVGARGGAFVTTPTSSQVGTGLADLFSLSTITATEVTEARLAFEVGIVPLIVKEATDEDIAELRAMVRQHAQAAKTGAYDHRTSTQFHTRLAACTRNAAVEMLVQTFHGPLLTSLLDAPAIAPLFGRKGCAEHAELVEAVAARNTELADSIMRTHIGRTAAKIRAYEKRTR